MHVLRKNYLIKNELWLDKYNYMTDEDIEEDIYKRTLPERNREYIAGLAKHYLTRE